MLGELSIMLVMRNRDVSAWYPVLLFMYPIFETCFSIYRKKFIRGMSPGIPDGVHLRMLVYKRLMRWAVGARIADRARADAPQFIDVAVSVVAVPDCCHCGYAVLATHAASVLLCRGVRADLRVALRRHRPVQVAEVAGDPEDTPFLMECSIPA